MKSGIVGQAWDASIHSSRWNTFRFENDMYCGHCKTENFSSTGMCIACGKPLTQSTQHIMFDKKNYVRYRQRSMPDTIFRAKYGFNIPTGVPLGAFGLSADAVPIRPGEHGFRPDQSSGQEGAAFETFSTAGKARQDALSPLIDPGFDGDEWERRFPSSGRKKRSIGARILHVMLGTIAFGLVIFAGFIAAWWINTNGDIRVLMAMFALQRTPAAAPAERAPPAPIKGTSSGELPYDGLPPDDRAIAATAGISVAAAGSPAGATAAGRTDRFAPSETSSTSASSAQGASAASSAQQAQKPPPVPAAKSKAKPDKARQKRRSSYSVAAARGKEIDRIQQQVDVELKKLKSDEPLP
ncbi:MAG TPA: hypothetical protein VHK70_07580 [Burkholderiaceae bacterium]|jgi:pyruvate/2-oxoglutarate dehydrogenase complex dihydrolipoamide acyltransferase (E2) component|nr:hypothetical protein [Burkholderiaceae bacterium]